MTNKIVGWALFGAAILQLLGLIGADIVGLDSWNKLSTTEFVGTTLVHISAVGTAFLGGKLIPTEPHNQREDDSSKDKP